MCLPCGHNFEIAKLDDLLGMHELYEMDEEGHGIKELLWLDLDVQLPRCPECGDASVYTVPRYAIFSQITGLGIKVDVIVKCIGLRLSQCSEALWTEELDLGEKIQQLFGALRVHPMAGGVNWRLMEEHLARLDKIASDTRDFRSKSSSPCS